MSLLTQLKSAGVQRDLCDPSVELDAARVFALVRDMPYRRAADRRSETVISEWQGTCSGKHYLLQALFAELGLSSQVMACTTVTPVPPDGIPAEVFPLYEAANRRFVDIHNYLLVDVPGDGQMLVDATFPLSARRAGITVNETFILGQSQQPAATPLQSWPIPPGSDPQEFKDGLLRLHFTPAELEFRELIIKELGSMTS